LFDLTDILEELEIETQAAFDALWGED